MSSNKFLIDASTRHQVFIQRFAGGEVKEIAKYFDEVEQELMSRLLKARTDFQVDKLQSQLKDVRAFVASAYSKMGSDITETVKEFGVYESEFAQRMVAKGTAAVLTEMTLPAPSQIRAAIFSKPMELVVGTGKKKQTIAKALSKYSSDKANEAVRVIRDGFLTGDTNLTIARKVQDTIDVQRRQAEALTRTIINHTGSVARSEFYSENDDVIMGERWLSVLDGATTPTCAALSGNVYAIGDGPYPPIHWNCRSVRVPLVNPKYNLGASITGTQASKGSDGGKQVSSDLTFGPWLKKQSAEFQKEYLGPERYKLFSKGGLSIKKFVDSDGAKLTLAELKKLEPVAFSRAGL